jgi:hypothetical protein
MTSFLGRSLARQASNSGVLKNESAGVVMAGNVGRGGKVKWDEERQGEMNGVKKKKGG